jgi:hypothetical protein
VNRKRPYHLMLAAVVVAAVWCAQSASAMEITQFDKMSVRDQGEYIALLIEGAQKVLVDEGRRDLAAQVRKLFTVRHPGESLSQGMVTLEANLAHARAVDADTHAHDRHAERLEVEQALIVTLKWSGIVLPKSFMRAGEGFRSGRHRK